MKRSIWAVFMAAALWAGGPAVAQYTDSSTATQDNMSGAAQTDANANDSTMTDADANSTGAGVTSDPMTNTDTTTSDATSDTTMSDPMTDTDTTTSDSMTNTDTTMSDPMTETGATTDTNVDVSVTDGQREVIEQEATTTTTITEPVLEDTTMNDMEGGTDTTTGTVDTTTTTTTTTETQTWDTGADANMGTTGEYRDAATYDDAGAYEADTAANDAGMGANQYYRTGWDPGALMLLGGGLMAGSLALRGRGRKRS